MSEAHEKSVQLVIAALEAKNAELVTECNRLNELVAAKPAPGGEGEK